MKLFEDTSLYVSIRVIGNQCTIEVGDISRVPLVWVKLYETVENAGNTFAELAESLSKVATVQLFANKKMGTNIEEAVEACRLVATSVR